MNRPVKKINDMSAAEFAAFEKSHGILPTPHEAARRYAAHLAGLERQVDPPPPQPNFSALEKRLHIRRR